MKLQASKSGLEKIKKARLTIGWLVEDERWLTKAAEFLPKQNFSGVELKGSVSYSTFKRFLQGKSMFEYNFKAFCGALKIDWKDVVKPTSLEINISQVTETDETKERNRVESKKIEIRDWGEALEIGEFYGRTNELSTLEKWVLTDHCRLISIFGIGGSGKTSLAAKFGTGGTGKSTLSLKLAKQFQNEFDCIIWKCLINSPKLSNVFDSIIETISQGKENLPLELKDKASLILKYLKKYRCLIIFDNLESVLDASDNEKQYIDGYEIFKNFLYKVGTIAHSSCILITSRENPKGIALIDGRKGPVRSLLLAGLNVMEASKIFEANGEFHGSDAELEKVIKFYHGNPLAIKIVAKHIQSLFNGSITAFLSEGKYIFGDLKDLLNWHFSRFSAKEKEVIYWFAINREPCSVEDLQNDIVSEINKRDLLDTLSLLERKLPIEKVGNKFTLQPVLIEYATETIIYKIYDELIVSNNFSLIMSHALVKAQAKTHIRDSQIKLIIEPLHKLIDLDNQKLKDKLIAYISEKRDEVIFKKGYFAGNIINFLCSLDIEIDNEDFSKVSVWQAYLQGRELCNINFSYSDLQKSVFTKTFGNISSVAFSSDNKYLAIGHTKNEASIWSLKNKVKTLSLRGHSNWVQAICFSPDNSFLATCGEDCSIRIWDLENSGAIVKIITQNYPIRRVQYNPINNFEIAINSYRSIVLLNTQTGETKAILNDQDTEVTAIAFCKDGRHIYGGYSDGTICLWDINSRKVVKEIEIHKECITYLSLSKDETYLVSSSYDRTVNVWNTKSKTLIFRLKGHVGNIFSNASSPTEEYIVSSSGDRTIRIWSLVTGDCVHKIEAHSSAIWSVAFSPDGKTIASGSGDQSVKLWDVESGSCIQSLQGHINSIWTLDYSPDFEILASGSEDGTIRFWDKSLRKQEFKIVAHEHIIWSISFSPNQQYLASCSSDKTVKLLNMRTKTLLCSLLGHTAQVQAVIFSPESNLLASTGNDSTIRVWNIQGDCLNILKGHLGTVNTLAFYKTSACLISGGADATIRVWNTEDSSYRILEGHEGSIKKILVYNNYIVSSSDDKTIRIWEFETGKIIKIFAGHTNCIHAMAITPKLKILASGGLDRDVRIWDLSTGELLRVLKGHKNSVHAMTFIHFEEGILATSSEDEELRLWNVLTGECLSSCHIPRPYANVNITGVTGISDAQKEDLRLLGAVED